MLEATVQKASEAECASSQTPTTVQVHVNFDSARHVPMGGIATLLANAAYFLTRAFFHLLSKTFVA